MKDAKEKPWKAWTSLNKFAVFEKNDMDEQQELNQLKDRMIVDQYLNKKLQPSCSKTNNWSKEMIYYFKTKWEEDRAKEKEGNDESNEDVYDGRNDAVNMCSANVLKSPKNLANSMMKKLDKVMINEEFTTVYGKAYGTIFREPPYPFDYPMRRLTMEEILAKFIGEGRREHEEMEIFIKEFRTNNELLLKTRSNLLSEWKRISDKRTKNQAKTDKTEHGMEKHGKVKVNPDKVKGQSQSRN
ncbi:hypothetical protein Tco_1344947 [Tanacetum coccineum]